MSGAWTAETLEKQNFRGPVAFYDYVGGGARQDFECVDEARFGYFWERKTRKDRGRQAYMVDGREVADLSEAATLLNQKPDPNSPKEIHKREHDEFRASPKLEYGATRALSEARCNADAGAFGMVRAMMQRAGHAWHVGINSFADKERQADRPWPGWMYDAKSAAHESYRSVYLFEADKLKDTGLMCALGNLCRTCPVLNEIEAVMLAQRETKMPSTNTDADIIAAKTWTCIAHILSSGQRPYDGAFWSTKTERDHPLF